MRRAGPYLVLTIAVVGMALSLFGCPGPGPGPGPSPSPTVSPTSSPTPEACLPPPGDAGWQPIGTIPPEHLEALAAERAVIGNRCGLPAEESLDLMAAGLRDDYGLCAGRKDDAVFVQRTDELTLWEEYHAVAYATGCWTIRERMHKGTWRYVAVTP